MIAHDVLDADTSAPVATILCNKAAPLVVCRESLRPHNQCFDGQRVAPNVDLDVKYSMNRCSCSRLSSALVGIRRRVYRTSSVHSAQQRAKLATKRCAAARSTPSWTLWGL